MWIQWIKLLQILTPDSPKLGLLLSSLTNPDLLYTPYGLRSLSATSPMWAGFLLKSWRIVEQFSFAGTWRGIQNTTHLTGEDPFGSILISLQSGSESFEIKMALRANFQESPPLQPSGGPSHAAGRLRALINFTTMQSHGVPHWIWVNSGLHTLFAGEVYRDLRDRVVNNVMKEYYRYTLNTIIWEHKRIFWTTHMNKYRCTYCSFLIIVIFQDWFCLGAI